MDEVSVGVLSVSPALMWGEIPLFDMFGGLELLRRCKAKGIGVLGIEGFRIRGSKRVPDMDYILDFSAVLNDPNFCVISVEMSEKILGEAIGEDLLFEFLLICVGKGGRN